MAAAPQADPIQSLFVNKIQEYAAKKKAADGGMVDATPETQAELQAELDKVAKAKEDQEATANTLEADKNFLAETEKGCQTETELYEKRTKVRNEELAAVSETISILASDDSKEQFNKSFDFLQTAQRRARSNGRARAADVLRKAGEQSDSEEEIVERLPHPAARDAAGPWRTLSQRMAAVLREAAQQPLPDEELDERESCDEASPFPAAVPS